MLSFLVIVLLVAAFVLFIVEAIRSRWSLLAIGLACWVLSEIILRWPK